MGLSHRENHYPSQLSGGQQQRIAIARALANNPKVLFADEPTGNLDSKSGRQVMESLQELNDNGITIVMVTHEREFAKYATKIIKMKDGEIIDTVKNNDKFKNYPFK
jgi:putative ABC transport system ATP-binding protein